MIGILGGGQLGKMLYEASLPLHIPICFLDNDENAPCANLADANPNVFHKGSITDEETVYNFGKNMDIISIEIENVNISALKRLESEGKKVFPQPHIIALIQDKGIQKEFYTKNEIPTSPFILVKNSQEIKDFFAQNPHKKSSEYVQKLRIGGYDGKGVQVIHDLKDVENPAFDTACVLEEKVHIKKELSVIVARNPKGEIKAFPAVEMVFDPKLNLVDYLLSPADISPAIAQQAQEIAQNIIEKLEMVGILAVEMFLDNENQILVNEIAPRPHNSGHQTIEANHISQYVQHLNAILGLDLGNTDSIMLSAMVNVLGENGYEGIAKYENLDKIIVQKDIFVHLYNKKITKSGRKMGHVTILDNDKGALLRKIEFVKNTLKVVC